MTRIVEVDEYVLVAGQVGPDAMEEIRALGVTMLVGNRPDGEEPGQPDWAEIARAAQEKGIETRHIPIVGGASEPAVQAMAEAMEAADGRVLAFCRSGTRSIWLWALARLAQGARPEDVVRKAQAAGYDLTALL